MTQRINFNREDVSFFLFFLIFHIVLVHLNRMMDGLVNEWMDAFRIAIFAYCGKRHVGKYSK